MFERYAIFYTPPPGPLADFGAAWLGWDNATGRPASQMTLDTLDVARLTEMPRKYGFHGTLKAPFRLTPGQSQTALKTACEDFARHHAAVYLDGMALVDLDGFVALRPSGRSEALGTLASHIVRSFDPLRAPLTDAEIARRNPDRLTQQQRNNLADWGYPFVMGDFRFHLTLSGPVDTATSRQMITALAPIVADLLPKPFPIDAITLLGQATDGRFHTIQRYALPGSSSDMTAATV